MNLHLSTSYVESWSDYWKKIKPKTFLTLYEEDVDKVAHLETLILKCPLVHRKLCQPKPTVLLAAEQQTDGLPDLPLLFPVSRTFVEDTVFQLMGAANSFQCINGEFLPAVQNLVELWLRKEAGKFSLSVFCLGENVDLDLFDAWKLQLGSRLVNKSSVMEIRIYIFNPSTISISPLCEGLTVFNLSQDPHLRSTVCQKLKYMFARGHGACSCSLNSTIGRVIYRGDDEDDRSYIEPLRVAQGKIEIVDASTLKRKKCKAQSLARHLKRRLRCKICLDLEVKVVYLPCGHLAVCGRCHAVQSEKGRDATCVMCRQKVTGCHEIFL